MTKTYVITGATSGIGKALVQALANDNIVFAGYRSEEKAKELQSFSDNIKPFYIDYANLDTISGAIEYINSETKKIDTLINIAGCVVAGPVENLSIENLRRQFDVNVFGHIQLTQGLIEKLENGKIINISSMSSFGIFPFISAYCASKRCLDMFFNSFLIENKRNIKVVSIKPGVIATPLWDKSIEENTALLKNCVNYEKEMEYIAKNAQKNSVKGLPISKVIKLILKVDSIKTPKLSYTIGKDAYVANIISKLPQNIINKIVKLALKLRMQK